MPCQPLGLAKSLVFERYLPRHWCPEVSADESATVRPRTDPRLRPARYRGEAVTLRKEPPRSWASESQEPLAERRGSFPRRRR